METTKSLRFLFLALLFSMCGGQVHSVVSSNNVALLGLAMAGLSTVVVYAVAYKIDKDNLKKEEDYFMEEDEECGDDNECLDMESRGGKHLLERCHVKFLKRIWPGLVSFIGLSVAAVAIVSDEQSEKTCDEPLDLSFRGLSSLEDEKLVDLKKYTTLFLEDNKFTSLTKITEQVNPNLTLLNIAKNKIKSLNSIGLLKNLFRVDVSHNEISIVPKEISKLNDLASFVATGNKLKQLSDELCTLQNLRLLNLSENQITRLSKNIGNMSRLGVLDLTSNKLTTLPDGMSDMKLLVVLYLASNELIPYNLEVIGKLKQLVKLDISGNKPLLKGENNEIDHLWNLHELVELYLSNNGLKELPEGIGNLRKLKILDLNNNNLTSIPEEIGNMQKLKKFNLSSNKLGKDWSDGEVDADVCVSEDDLVGCCRCPVSHEFFDDISVALRAQLDAV